MENLYTPNCIRTFSGKYIDVFDPKPEDICIEDIAHALAHTPRFGGHLPVFYSVAQHSIMCAAMIVNPKKKLEALLHDATEAYILDMPKPIKERLPDYMALESKLQKVISEKFDLPLTMSEDVKEVDRVMLEYEWEHIMVNPQEDKKQYAPLLIKKEFLKLFEELSGK